MDSRDRPLQNLQRSQMNATQNSLLGHTPLYPSSFLDNQNPASSQMMMPFHFNSVMESPNVSSGFDGSQSEFRSSGFDIDSNKRKKRGRPRKYSPDGNISLGLTHTPMPISSPSAAASAAPVPGNSNNSADPSMKKHRGRPSGTGKKQLDALGSGGTGFTPHVILVNPGEDITSKVLAFSQQGPRSVCILSAQGSVSNVSLAAVPSGRVTYEGRFDIISLSGSFLVSENNDNRTHTSCLSVSLANADGQIFGGITYMLTAASTVQVIVGSFNVDGKKTDSSVQKSGQSSAPHNTLNFRTPAAADASPSEGASEDSSDAANGGSPLSNRGQGIYTNANQPIHNNMYQLWGNHIQQ